jgi:hypothetical protein
MKRSALPLVFGVYGLVRMCLSPSRLQALRKSKALYQEPLSVMTRSTVMPRLA